MGLKFHKRSVGYDQHMHSTTELVGYLVMLDSDVVHRRQPVLGCWLLPFFKSLNGAYHVSEVHGVSKKGDSLINALEIIPNYMSRVPSLGIILYSERLDN